MQNPVTSLNILIETTLEESKKVSMASVQAGFKGRINPFIKAILENNSEETLAAMALPKTRGKK